MAYTITLKQGNLLEESNTTFMVNASNTKLLLGSGVSMALKRYCTIELQQKMIQQLQTIGTLYKGDCVVTPALKAVNFIYILHIAIIDYNKGVKGKDKLPTLQDISDGLYNIEKYLVWYAKKYKKASKVVLPLLGCGAGGLKKEDVINLYKEFFTQKFEYVCEVVIYGYSKEDYQLLKQLFAKENDAK